MIEGKGGDYAFGDPSTDGPALAEAGIWAVGRYLDYGPGAGGKQLTDYERDQLHASGIAIWAINESTGGRALEGYEAGKVDAAIAQAEMARLGFPPDRPCYFAVDTDIVTDEQFHAVRQYFRGAAEIIGIERTGVYGEYSVCVHLSDRNLATWFWQCIAWSGGYHFAGRNIYQYTGGQPFNGHLLDHNTTYGEDFGQWPSGGLSMEDKERLTRLENLIGGFGIAKDPKAYIESGYDSELLTFGEDALEYAAERQWSAFLGVGLAQNQPPVVNNIGGLVPGTKFTSEVISDE